jgi:nucleotide-binding universal stress UspA family protein
MFSTVLVATDLSPASDHVISCLHGMRPLGTTRVILTHALGVRHLEEMVRLLAHQAEPKLRQQKQAVEDQGFEVEAVMAPGIPSMEINRVANEKRASMIVIGSHGATLGREVLLGGVALEVLHRAELPVFIAQLKIFEGVEKPCGMICDDFHTHVLFATDFSDIAERAFTYVEQVVRGGGRRVTLLHVQDKSRIQGHLSDKLDEFNRIDRERLDRMAVRLKELGATEVGLDLPYGVPKQEIARSAEQGGYSLVVMGTQGRGYFGELFMGSVAHYVARHTLVPTLLIPPLR